MDLNLKTALQITKEKTSTELARISYRNEHWHDMDEDYPGYAVSDYGRVFSYKSGALIQQFENSVGYYRVHLHVDTRDAFPFVHRLVAAHFLANPYNKRYVNHEDGDKSNNTAANLSWVTASENVNHSLRKLRKHDIINQIDPETNTVVEKYDYIIDAADTLKLNANSISRAIKLGKAYAGYNWTRYSA